MPFRTIVVSTHSKLEYSMGYLIHRTIDSSTKIPLSEINVLLVESNMVSITSSLINELVKGKIKVIFCDEKHNPSCEIAPYNSNFRTPKCYLTQINWSNEVKRRVRKAIIYEKIRNQSITLFRNGYEDKSNKLLTYLDIMPDDLTNREGHAAKVYFNALFGNDFTRDCDNEINSALDYGYSILLSYFNRELAICGYLTQIGVHHKGSSNEFNLSCDLMEPFRPIVDDKVKNLKDFSNFKKEMLSLFNIELEIDGKKQLFYNAIKVYTRSVLEALEKNNIEEMKFFKNYEI